MTRAVVGRRSLRDLDAHFLATRSVGASVSQPRRSCSQRKKQSNTSAMRELSDEAKKGKKKYTGLDWRL